jgi:hypothetical protein
MRYLTVCLLLALAGPAQARDYAMEARAALALSLALQARPEPARPAVKTCACSELCTCGCATAGEPCRCGSPTVVTAPVQPVPYFSRPAYYAPAPSFRQSFAPAFRGSGGACRSG